MIFPKHIKPGDTIAVTALSNGLSKEEDKARFQNGKKKLGEKGYKVEFTENVFTADAKGRSSDGKTRAAQLDALLRREDVSCIFSAKGGDFLVEMLEFVDFDSVRVNPKWIQGYSDNTAILFPITTKLDIATAYGSNFGDFGMQDWDVSVRRNLEILEGKTRVQTSFEMYEDGFHDKETGLEGYRTDMPVLWRNLRGEESITMQGRLIGGCLDVLLTLAGTRYDGAVEYVHKYREDGIIWYLESFDLNSEALMMGLWRLREMGWFEHCRGIVFGRPLLFSTFTDTSYDEAVLTMLGSLDVPIIMDADIGHKGPQFVMINGAIARIFSAGGKGDMVYRDYNN
ncbi:S66 family peptidase [Parasporobacterium paucivorans]|uniref:Muramoyltetrapeptide carboxypeptidase LdcA (Peptidoglycan recycling) n=1 Tax=Parasporobacterium paucivorans DSM 15970 TaxID=1122934 RepID=A0A1M6CBF9_9FIRM|nr:S66 peptidase family protein [Parasporobacterium paucivorans]SHI58058.1 Muramoyltetrapeptide carboxypeptidase LdcA (peptidoglycan recycling) [Parasporobacterium paucivorans DSM 15970]